MGLVLAFFQDGFTRSLRKNLLQLKLKDRLGMIASFILIDLDNSGTLDLDEFGDFLKMVTNDRINEKQIQKIFSQINTNEDDEENESSSGLSIKEFVEGIERTSELEFGNREFKPLTFGKFLSLEKRNKRKTLKEKLSFLLEALRWIVYPVVASRYFDILVIGGLFLQIWILSLYGTYTNYEFLDTANGILVLLNVVDVLIKVLVYQAAVTLRNLSMFCV